MRSPQQRLLMIIGGTAVLVLAVLVLLSPVGKKKTEHDQQHAQPNITDSQDNAADQQATKPAQPTGDGEQKTGEDQEIASLRASPEGEGMAAGELYALGVKLTGENKLVQARSVLSRALLSGRLSAAEANDAQTRLADLANETLFSSRVYDDDPYTFRYVVQPGDMLAKLEVRLQLHVPHILLREINGLKNDTIYAGQTLKMVRGPFHAVVDKSDLTMDIYLHREGLEKLFIARMPVGLGKDNGTPSGMWQVELGGKAVKPPWYPPPGSGLNGRIEYGDPNYAFGEKGLWIPLVGLDEDNKSFRGYGIHSTNKPETIGRTASLGCIRLRDENIEVVFALLYEKWSTVEVRP